MSLIDFETILYFYVDHIKKFNEHLFTEFNLTDIPYNVAGKSFAKDGFVNIDGVDVEYHFHGRGCTLFWNGLHIFFNIDVTSIHQIIVTPGGWHCFLETYLPDYKEKGYSSIIESIL